MYMEICALVEFYKAKKKKTTFNSAWTIIFSNKIKPYVGKKHEWVRNKKKCGARAGW